MTQKYEATKKELKTQIESFAKSLGFDLVGFTIPKIAPSQIKTYKNWLKKNHNANMKYMEKTSPRKNLKEILPNAASVIVLAKNYYYDQNPLKRGHARVARYAYGRDYHKTIKKKLIELEKFIQSLKPSKIQTKSYVDTGPILERALAQQAGLGAIGKNSCLITKKFGTWIFLAEIITDLELLDKKNIAQEEKLSPGTLLKPFPLCGTCTRCIDACPTKAIIAPGIIDARRCISYLTIEHKGKIPPPLAKIIKEKKLLFGCDICQEACPHNQARQKPLNSSPPRGGETSHSLPQEAQKIAGDQLPLKKILAIESDQQFLKTFAGSPLMRTKREGLHRNAGTIV